MEKLSFETMENVEGGKSALACGEMVLWGIAGVLFAAAAPITLVSAAGAIGSAAAMLNAGERCAS
jgi:hypothetical protein